jgi:hypothetical protein
MPQGVMAARDDKDAAFVPSSIRIVAIRRGINKGEGNFARSAVRGKRFNPFAPRPLAPGLLLR